MSKQAYTEKQLYLKLEQRELDKEIISELILKLRELNLVNDKTYTQQYINSRKTKKGPEVLRQELKQKGITNELIEENISKLDNKQQQQAMLTILEKNQWRLKGNRFKQRQKAYNFLIRRGFSKALINEVLEEFFKY